MKERKKFAVAWRNHAFVKLACLGWWMQWAENELNPSARRVFFGIRAA